MPSMSFRDQELQDMQFCWLNSSRADGLLALSFLTAILLCILLVGATIA
jgi:hypothetical protein